MDLLYLAIAYLLALPIGWNREQEAQTAGVRTFPIVAVASCGVAMIAVRFAGASADSSSRVLQGLITGIGFVGGGAILRHRNSVTGTATAASIWNTSVVGAAVGFGLLHVAVILSALNLITLRLMAALKPEDPPDI